MKRNYELFPGCNDDGIPRSFVVTSSGTAEECLGLTKIIEHMGFSPRLQEAMNLFYYAGIENVETHRLLVACEKKGDDPVKFANHFLKLRKVVQDNQRNRG